jgi:hypothetical protein
MGPVVERHAHDPPDEAKIGRETEGLVLDARTTRCAALAAREVR